MHLVFIGAHPDDETSAGGTIAKHVDRDHEATIVVATRGGRGHWSTPSEELERVRTGEMEKAAEILGRTWSSWTTWTLIFRPGMP